jgi:hypothetical protein
MTYLDKICERYPITRNLVEGCRVLRVHNDVIALADGIVHDDNKLKAAAPYIFAPAERTWIEWEDERGKIAMFLDGIRGSVQQGRGIFMSEEHSDPETHVMVSFTYDLAAFVMEPLAIPATMTEDNMDFVSLMSYNQVSATALLQLKPIVFAILALINSPKIIRSKEIDLTRLNKKRVSMGRYTFHPHHEVRLNVDKRVITTVKGESDGASKCLHFVRTHLRFVPTQGGYTLVHPHWRGDPALGIRDTHYYADRQNSRWAQ